MQSFIEKKAVEQYKIEENVDFEKKEIFLVEQTPLSYISGLSIISRTCETNADPHERFATRCLIMAERILALQDN